MKYLALAVLLTIIQTAAPIPRKAADPGNRASQNVKNASTDDSQAPPQQPQTVAQPTTAKPDQNTDHSPAAENTQKPVVIRELPPVSVSKDWLDKLYIFLTGVLIVVGGFGVRAAYKTLGEIKAQREAMQGQLTAMQGQLTQAAQQTRELKTAADIALVSAQAAVE